jgi:omega-6 fatty acid desaturase (delta-12 desaturase)
MRIEPVRQEVLEGAGGLDELQQDLNELEVLHPSALPPAGMLTRQVYLRIRAELQFEPSAGAVAATLLINHGLLAFGLLLLAFGGTAEYWLAQLIFPVVFFQGFSLLHDCGHGSALPRSWQNTLLGHYASILCGLPFYGWKYHHGLHHAWAGNLERDPTLQILRTYRRTRRMPWILRAAWRSWVPLAALLQHVVFWAYPIRALRAGHYAQALRSAGSVLFLFASYAGLHALAPELFRLSNFAPAIVLYLVGNELVNLPHHADLPTSERKLALWEQAFTTRSCYYPRFVSELLVLNFNFHTEHHLFPTLPWYRLRQARTLVRDALGTGYQEATGIQWNLRKRSTDLRDVLKTR